MISNPLFCTRRPARTAAALIVALFLILGYGCSIAHSQVIYRLGSDDLLDQSLFTNANSAHLIDGLNASGTSSRLSLGLLNNKVTLTQPATAATLTISDNKTLTVQNSLTLSGTDGSTLNVGTGGTLGTAALTDSSAYQPADSDLTAIAALNATGLAAQTAAGTWAQRTITGTTNYITVTNGNGVSGDPILTIGSNVTTTDTIQTITANKTFSGNTTVNGPLIFGTSPVAAAATVDLPSTSNVLLLTGGSDVTVTAFTGGVAGQVFTVISTMSSGNVTLTNSSTLKVRGGSNLILAPANGCSLYVRSSGNYTVW